MVPREEVNHRPSTIYLNQEGAYERLVEYSGHPHPHGKFSEGERQNAEHAVMRLLGALPLSFSLQTEYLVALQRPAG